MTSIHIFSLRLEHAVEVIVFQASLADPTTLRSLLSR